MFIDKRKQKLKENTGAVKVETHQPVDNPCFGTEEVVITSETCSEYII